MSLSVQSRCTADSSSACQVEVRSSHECRCKTPVPTSLPCSSHPAIGHRPSRLPLLHTLSLRLVTSRSCSCSSCSLAVRLPASRPRTLHTLHYDYCIHSCLLSPSHPPQTPRPKPTSSLPSRHRRLSGHLSPAGPYATTTPALRPPPLPAPAPESQSWCPAVLTWRLLPTFLFNFPPSVDQTQLASQGQPDPFFDLRPSVAALASFPTAATSRRDLSAHLPPHSPPSTTLQRITTPRSFLT